MGGAFRNPHSKKPRSTSDGILPSQWDNTGHPIAKKPTRDELPPNHAARLSLHGKQCAAKRLGNDITPRSVKPVEPMGGRLGESTTSSEGRPATAAPKNHAKNRTRSSSPDTSSKCDLPNHAIVSFASQPAITTPQHALPPNKTYGSSGPFG